MTKARKRDDDVPPEIRALLVEWHERFEAYGLPDHMWDDFQAYAVRGREPSRFLNAVLRNSLIAAAEHADHSNLPMLHVWAKFLYNTLPTNSWGNAERVREWMEKGGLIGVVTA